MTYEELPVDVLLPATADDVHSASDDLPEAPTSH